MTNSLLTKINLWGEIELFEEKAKKFKGFDIISTSQNFFTSKKEIMDSGCYVEVTFKPRGVSPMEEHMYMLLPFKKLDFQRLSSGLSEGDKMLPPTFAVW